MRVDFSRERVRHPLVMRRLCVTRVQELSPTFRRITLGGAELVGFVSPGPADHVKVFFPDKRGMLTTPVISDTGIIRPENGELISRDYTPVSFLDNGTDGPELDLDFVVHGDEGPASAWAARASKGNTIGVAGPRGSLLAPAGIGQAVIIADETALPAARRWFEALAQTQVTGLFPVSDKALTEYIPKNPTRTLHWFTDANREAAVLSTLRSLTLAADSFIFLAGEAHLMAKLRRYLRRELGLAKEQVEAHGYWKRGFTDLDHHAPLDPTDPD